jgi:hypothetical protein
MPRIPTYQDQSAPGPQGGGLGVRAPEINIPGFSQRPMSGGLRQVPMDLAQAPVPIVNPSALTQGMQSDVDSFAYLSRAFDTVSHIGQMVGRAREQAVHTQQTATLNKATAQSSKALNSWMIEYAERQDYQTFDEEYRGRVKELREQAVQGLEGAYKQKFLASFDTDVLHNYAKLRSRVRKMATDDALASSAQLEQQEKEQLILDPSPAARDRIQDRNAARQDQLAQLGLITKQKAVEKKQEFAASRAEVEIREMINENPEKMAEAIANPSENVNIAKRLSFMTPSKRAALFNEAQSEYRQRLNDLERAESQRDRMRRREQDANVSEYLKMARERKLTLPILDKAVEDRKIDRGDYAFLRARALEVFPPNPALKQEVHTAILSKEWDGGLKGIAWLNLPVEDVLSLQNTYRQVQKADDISNTPAYKMAMTRIEQTIAPSGPGAILDTAEGARLADASREFDERVRQGEDIKKVEDDIKDRYRVEQVDIGRYPKPRYGNKPDITNSSLPEIFNDLANIKRKTEQALKAGNITQQDYRREILNLKGIAEAAEREASRQKNTSKVRR